MGEGRSFRQELTQTRQKPLAARDDELIVNIVRVGISPCGTIGGADSNPWYAGQFREIRARVVFIP